jgi:ubiquinone/menaquinone biosynthesis C-methylase UbiE
MDDRNHPAFRFEVIHNYLSGATHILDMASGCGTFVFNGLLNDYDVYGIEPEEWKQTFVKLKAKEYGYPRDWLDRFLIGVGEELPFRDNSFDCVSTYQTLEHVQDLKRCLCEMVRVTKSGGGIHIRCPDYRSTYEGHYCLPWFPLFPRNWARSYLRLLGKPSLGLDTVQYVTLPRIVDLLKRQDVQGMKKLGVVDLDKNAFLSSPAKQIIPYLPYPLFRFLQYCKHAFRRELNVNLFVFVETAAD